VFNLSGTEIVVILLLALVVLGPEKLPDAIRKFGKTYAELKKMGTGFQQEFKSAIDEPMREMRETADLLKKSADFTTTTAKPDPPSAAPAAVTNDIADRPTRNESLLPADTEVEPTDDLPFAEVEPTEDVPFAEVEPAEDVPFAEVEAADDVPFAEVEPIDDLPFADADTEAAVDKPPPEGQPDRGEADNA
jgi:sec-independent protein translocase protein TatB